MQIQSNIQNLMKVNLESKGDIENYLNNLSNRSKEQLIDALYLGRDHIHETKIRKENMPISSYRLNMVDENEFSQIILEKRNSLEIYYNKFLECAKNSGINPDTL